MKKFFLKILLFTSPLLLLAILLVWNADGYLDAFYIRFTTPKHKSMILGTSRAAQGLQPKVFDSLLKRSLGNYAFTLAHSPFGRVYYESIKRKHNKEKGGLFIVAVDPWSISSWVSNPNNLDEFRENDLCLNNTKVVDMNPNVFYLYQNFSGRYKDLFYFNTKMNTAMLHKDGWLEISNIAMDSASVNKRIANKVKTYRIGHLPNTKLSTTRIEYLKKTINYLKKYGTVYLVRLPIHESMMKVEDDLMPDFDIKIKDAIEMSNGYLDMTEQNSLFQYTDGNHLYKTSGKIVSSIVAKWIKEQAQPHNNVNKY